MGQEKNLGQALRLGHAQYVSVTNLKFSKLVKGLKLFFIWLHQIHPLITTSCTIQSMCKAFKGKEMSGRMGGMQRTVKNVWVYKINPARNSICVRGQVRGNEGDFVFLKDALYKKPDISTLLFLTYFSTEDEDVSSLKPLVADLGKTDLCMATD